MPIYTYKNPKTGEVFEEIRPMSDADKPFILEDGTECERVFDPGSVWMKNANAEVWQKDPDYVKKMNPKYVRRRDGVRERYDPTRHR